jgi:hypothetical protein
MLAFERTSRLVAASDDRSLSGRCTRFMIVRAWRAPLTLVNTCAMGPEVSPF